MMVAETEIRRQDEADLSRDWRRALLALGIGLAAILLLYRPTVGAMVEIWWRSETFTHGFLVAPISLWLIWRRRARIMAAPPRASSLGAALLACAGFAWLLADLASVNSPSQFALVAMLIGYTWAILGGRAVREMLFPLFFLFFAVPFGEFLLPPMMNMTADFTIAALKATGIPVYREGLHFVIPSGSWSVVEACSGVRYLIASLMVGTLYGYLNYHSPARRALFFLAAALVPILANWVRAYMIVMLGHLSGNTLAVGVDHLIYGWVFFGLVMLLMFWIGARWREDDLPPLNPIPAADATAAAQRAMRLNGALALGAALLWMPLGYALEHARAVLPAHLAPLAGAGGWAAGASPLTQWQPHHLGARAALEQEFARGPDRVRLTVAYYSHQTQDGELINIRNQLLPTSEKNWILVSSGQVHLAAPPTRVRVAEIKGMGQRLWAWHWYWIDGRTSVSDIEAKLLLAKSKLLLKGDESASVVVVTEAENAEAAARILGDFVTAHWPAIDAGIAAAEGGGK